MPTRRSLPHVRAFEGRTLVPYPASMSSSATSSALRQGPQRRLKQAFVACSACSCRPGSCNIQASRPWLTCATRHQGGKYNIHRVAPFHQRLPLIGISDKSYTDPWKKCILHLLTECHKYGEIPYFFELLNLELESYKPHCFSHPKQKRGYMTL